MAMMMTPIPTASEGDRKVAREYAFNNLAGCVVQRKSRETGLLVGLYNAEQAGMDPEAGPWVTVCEEHGQLVNHSTLKLAMWHLADPKGWCEVCNGTETNNWPNNVRSML